VPPHLAWSRPSTDDPEPRAVPKRRPWLISNFGRILVVSK
jgi:hypothetical protein